MKPRLIDSHAHAQFSDYDGDRREVIGRALNAGIWMVNSGADLESSEKAVELAEEYNEGVYATVGIHPSEESAKIHDREFWRKMEKLARNDKCVAVGECGLEYLPPRAEGETGFSETNDKKEQVELFVRHIELASEAGKPLVIHCRDAYEDLYGILKENRNKLIAGHPALMHFFSGTVSDADRFLEMGFVFSFGGAATFPPKPGKTDFISLIKRLPLGAILLETDCPYVSPVPLRGQRNEPSFVTHVAKKLAETKGIREEEMAEATTENAIRFFAIGGASR